MCQRLMNAVTILMATKAKRSRTSLPTMPVSIENHPVNCQRMKPTTGMTKMAGIISQAQSRRLRRSHSLTYPSGEIQCSMQRTV